MLDRINVEHGIGDTVTADVAGRISGSEGFRLLADASYFFLFFSSRFLTVVIIKRNNPFYKHHFLISFITF